MDAASRNERPEHITLGGGKVFEEIRDEISSEEQEYRYFGRATKLSRVKKMSAMKRPKEEKGLGSKANTRVRVDAGITNIIMMRKVRRLSLVREG